MAETTELPDELTIQLRKPLSFGDVTYTELKLCEPTAAQISEWDKLTGVEADIKAVSIMSGAPEVVVRQLPAREFYKAARFIGAFLG